MPQANVMEPRAQQDPREKHEKPPFPEQRQEFPGHESQLEPKADHGEQSYRGSHRLTDKVALITGADSGIGRAAAIAFAREGAHVVVSYLNEREDAAETIRWIESTGRKALSAEGDIQDEAHCQNLIRRTIEEFGRLDVLVNNAAFQMTRSKIEAIPSEEFDRTFRTNVYAMFYLCKAAIPHLKPGGSIINTASIQAYDPSANLLAYAASKGAIVTFTKALSKMVSEQGLRANVVAPGPVWTPLIPYSMPQHKIQRFGENTAFGRAAQPAELAPLYVFLASPESSYITGEVFGATGGRMPT